MSTSVVCPRSPSTTLQLLVPFLIAYLIAGCGAEPLPQSVSPPPSLSVNPIVDNWYVEYIWTHGVPRFYRGLTPVEIDLGILGKARVLPSECGSLEYALSLALDGMTYSLSNKVGDADENCPPEMYAQHVTVTNALEATNQYLVEGDRLTLTGDGVIMRLVRDNPPVSPLPTPTPPAGTEVDGFAIMLQYYADAFGISTEEAQRRLQMQSDSARVVGVASGLPNYAGGWIEHVPDLTIVVAIADEEDRTAAENLIRDSGWTGPYRVVKREKTLPVLEADQTKVMEIWAQNVEMQALVYGIGTDIPAGKIALYTPDIRKLQELIEGGFFAAIRLGLEDFSLHYQSGHEVPAGEAP